MKFGAGCLVNERPHDLFGDLRIKGRTTGEDFRYYDLDPTNNCVGGEEALSEASNQPGLDVPMEFKHSTKDDCTTDLDQKFAVWSAQDVQALKAMLDGSFDKNSI